MQSRVVSVLLLVLFILQAGTNRPAINTHMANATNLQPNVDIQRSLVTVTTQGMTLQLQIDRPDFLLYYPQDLQNEFRFKITFQQLMEVSQPNQTLGTQVLDILNLQTLAWLFRYLGNGTDSSFGLYTKLELVTSANIQRGSVLFPVNVSIVVFTSEKENETAVVANDWAALESIGGPLKIKLEVSVKGWPFRIPADMLVLRLALDGSLGSVDHSGEFIATELFNTVAMINSVTRRQDAYVQWLRRAIIDTGISQKSADVTLRTFHQDQALLADLYYPSFGNGTLRHDPVIGVSDGFVSSPYIPVRVLELLVGASSMLGIALMIAFVSRQTRFSLRRNR